MKEGERIHVRTKDRDGMATILYIAPGEMYPVQVEMDEPDGDGHKIMRISWIEVATETQEPADNGIIFEDAADTTKYLGEVIKTKPPYRFEIGQQFALGVITFPGVYKPGTVAKSFYVHDAQTLKFRGCMPANMFKVLGLFEEVATEEVIEEPFIEEQLSLFDF